MIHTNCFLLAKAHCCSQERAGGAAGTGSKPTRAPVTPLLWGVPVVSNPQKADCEFPHRRRQRSSVTLTGGIQSGRVCPGVQAACPVPCSAPRATCSAFSLGKPGPVPSAWLLSEDVQLEQGSGAVSSCSQCHTGPDAAQWWLPGVGSSSPARGAGRERARAAPVQGL